MEGVGTVDTVIGNPAAPPPRQPAPAVPRTTAAPTPHHRRALMETTARRRHSAGYSRFVHATKWLLPIVAGALIVLISVWPYLRTQDLKFRISFAAFNAGEAEDPSMVNPRYLGIDKDNQAYSVTADLARRLTSEALNVELEMPKADITLNDGTWLVLTADTGMFERAQQTLDLTGAVNLFHDSGYEFRTTKARIELAKGVAKGDQAVLGQGPFGDLKAEGFELIDKGKTILFTGKSKMVLYPGVGREAGLHADRGEPATAQSPAKGPAKSPAKGSPAGRAKGAK
jgi:lipopolysaccharide export system protein LptC